MKLNLYDEIKKLTKEMVAIPSINKEPGGETKVAEYVYDFYGSLPYFQEHKDQFKIFQTKNDFVERHSTYGYVKGTKGGFKSNRTIILLGHIDTVGVDDYGTIKEYAFNCDELPAKLMETFELAPEVIEDINSGEFMFGRGALDMKAGVAVHMALIKYFSEHTDELEGNIIAIAECDEEDNSKGMITALDELVELKKKEGFEYVACINSDYSTNYAPGDENRYIYHGSIGKVLPSFVVFGKEAHVGQAFTAFDPNLLIAEITRNMSLNVDLCDVAGGEVAIPPISLKQTDTKVGYTVQTALVAYSYFNFFMHGKGPKDVLDQCKEVAQNSFENIIGYLNQQYERFCQLSGIEATKLPWQPRVYIWKEFYDLLAKTHGESYTKHIEGFARKLHEEDPELDMRVYSLKVIEESWKFMSDKSPAVVLFFGSIYSGRIEMTGKTPGEKALLEAVDVAIERVRPEARRQIKTRMFYPYISDSSFMAVYDEADAVQAVEDNMPAWGPKYTHDIDKILEINVPVVNIGTFGRDGHMLTERVDMYHTFQNVPNITYETIVELIG